MTDDGAATWAAFDTTGRMVSSASRGSLDAAKNALEGRRSVVLVPAVDVIATQTELPAASQSRLRQIVPFSLEESLAEDIEQMAFAIGARRASGVTPVAIVAKQRLDAWLAELTRAGIVPQALYSDAEGVPDIPGTLVLLLEGEHVYGRCADQAPFALDGLTLRQVLDIARGPNAAESALRHLLVYADEAGRVAFQGELVALGEEFDSAEVKVAGDGLFPHLAATLAQRAGTNLLQGEYAPRSNWLALARPWRLAASLLVASAVLALLAQGAQFWQLRRTDVALAELVGASCERLVGDSRPSACQREVQQRLGAGAESGTGPDFLATLAAIAASRDTQMRIEALSYRNRAMDVRLVAPSVPVLDEFARGLEQTRLYEVEIEGANQTDAGTEGLIRIVGANR
jgi:general secretion pathway protein L